MFPPWFLPRNRIRDRLVKQRNAMDYPQSPQPQQENSILNDLNYLYYQPGETWVMQKPAPEPHTCPVCEGRGDVPHGFYSNSPHSSTDATADVCRSCSGRGILWS